MPRLLIFFAATFAVTWSSFLAAAALWQGASPNLTSLAGAIFFLGVIAPSLVAIVLTAREGGRPAVAALLGRILHYDVGVRWYLFALAFFPAAKLAVAVLHRLATGQWPAFGDVAWYLIAPAIFLSTWVQAGEEIGWRGYALPRLAALVGLAPASVLLGTIWAAWHLPLFFVAGADTYHQSFPVYLLQVTALSVAFAWTYWRTGGSLLVVMVLHAAVNNTKAIVPAAAEAAAHPFTLSASLASWLGAAVLWAAAVWFLASMWRARLPPGWPAHRTSAQNEVRPLQTG